MSEEETNESSPSEEFSAEDLADAIAEEFPENAEGQSEEAVSAEAEPASGAEGVAAAEPVSESSEEGSEDLPSTDEVADRMAELKAQRESMAAGLDESTATPNDGGDLDLMKPNTTTDLVAADLDEKRGDIKATTLGKLMGLATSNEMRLMEGKIDLLSTRINAMLMKLEKVSTLVADVPTSSDLDRIDVQLASLRTLIKEVVDGSLQKALDEERKKADQRAKEKAEEQKKLGENVVSNSPAPASE